MKRTIYKASIILPLILVFYSFMEPFAFCVPEIGLYLDAAVSRFLIVVVTVLWLCCSPFKKSCCNGTITEPLFNMIPVEFVLMLVFAERHFVFSVLISVCLLAGEIALFIAFRKDEKKRKFSKKRHRRYQAAFRRCSVLGITVICAIPCLLSLFVYGMSSPVYEAEQDLWDLPLSEMETKSDSSETNDPYQINTELWQCFEIDKWTQWSISEKITIMQQLVDFESDILGIPTIPVKSGMIGPFTLGAYDNDTNEMWINTEHLANSSAEAAIQTICHEVYHSNQYYLVSTLDWNNPALNSAYFKELRDWMNNQDDYKSAWAYGFSTYENQPLEVTAREYALEETSRIMVYID